MKNFRIGNGYDVHRFVNGRDLIIGGVRIDYQMGLFGHSDADVLIHSIIDSILSPANIGDIGKQFPDNDPDYKDINSLILLKEAYIRVKAAGYRIINSDSIVICEQPKILPYVDEMKKNISMAMSGEVDVDAIGIKGKTNERLGFTGRGEGIAVYTVTLLCKE